MRKQLKIARRKIEIVLIRAALFIIPFWPRWLILACARLTGRIGFYLARGQRRLTLANLDIAFGDKKAGAEKKRIAVRSFQIMTLVFLDYFWFARNSNERIKKYALFDQSFKNYFPSPPAVVATAHFGGWELLSRTMATNGYPHTAVFSPLSNPETSRIIESCRAIENVEMIPMRGAVRGLLRSLRKGIYIALVMDQNTKPADGGIFVEFFGRPVPMSTSAAMLAERMNVPITPLFCVARWDGTYLVYALPLVRAVDAPAGPDSIRDLTRKIAEMFQQEIEKQPEQWMWMYKRWKHIKPGTPPGIYPYYAKPMY
jgi:Kdo2-lipid IVA lauroyltransferase/acyltransferase